MTSHPALPIKNGISNDVIPNVLIPVNTSTAMGAIHRVNISKVANALEVETDGKAYLLAGGMDPTTAFGLLHDLSKVLRLETPSRPPRRAGSHTSPIWR